MLKRMLLLALACLALVAAGCGDDDKKKDSGDSGGDATPADTSAGGGAGKDAGGGTAGEPDKVDMKDIKYIPQDITVKTGATIEWTNSDQVEHTVTKDGGPGAEFDSGNIAPGKTYEQKFDTAGTIDYKCLIHPNQTGKVIVQ